MLTWKIAGIAVCSLIFCFTSPAVFAQSSVVPSGTDAASENVLPLSLTFQPRKPSFGVGEKIQFDLVLTNISHDSFRVFKLDEKSVSCDINGLNWGTKEASGEAAAILMPGESIRKSFKVSGVKNAGKFTVSCSYGMGIKGAHPNASMLLDIHR
jgi:hypothetical protein